MSTISRRLHALGIIQKQENWVPFELKPRNVDFAACQRLAQCCKTGKNLHLETLKWEVLLHSLYSPDIAPSDYHLFRSMTHGLSEQRFTFMKIPENGSIHG